MAYDRYDTRDDHPRWRDSSDRGPDRGYDRGPSGRSEGKGFFERAGDEIASWFGDDRPGPDRNRNERDRNERDRQDRDRSDPRLSREDRGGWNPDRDRSYDRGYGRDAERDRETSYRDRETSRDRDRDRDESYRGTAWPSSERDYNPSWRDELRDRPDDRQRGYRPMTGDYGRSEQRSSPSGFSGNWRGDRDQADRDNRSEWGRDPYRSTSRAGTRDQSDRSRDLDPHYRSWRDQHMSSLDRDYDDYRRENQSKFDSDFSSWRERRTHKRGLLGQIREHMEVVGSDDSHVGKVDKVAGDRVILAKSDPDSGGVHHSLSCSHIDRVEGDKVILDCPAAKAREQWRDESRSRALFEREDSGEMGNHALNRAFEGTYR